MPKPVIRAVCPGSFDPVTLGTSLTRLEARKEYFGGDVSRFLPDFVNDALVARLTSENA